MSPQPFESSSPDQVPPGRNSLMFLRRQLFNFHSYRAMQRSLPASVRRFHRKQAQILAKKLKVAQKPPWDWKSWCRQHSQDVPGTSTEFLRVNTADTKSKCPISNRGDILGSKKDEKTKIALT
jgi:hypothetical protein